MEKSTPTCSLHNISSPSATAIRFLGLLNQPDTVTNPLELEESDVIWPSSDSPTSSTHSTPSQNLHHQNHHFRPDKSGLSAALSDDHRPILRRKPSLDPSFSAASAARTIPPVPVPRSGSGSGDSTFAQSAPVNVPATWRKGYMKAWQGSEMMRGLEGGGVWPEEEDEMMPPHEIVARSHASAFSVCEGVGRTLKGRDQRRVRNAVWQKIGFID